MVHLPMVLEFKVDGLILKSYSEDGMFITSMKI